VLGVLAGQGFCAWAQVTFALTLNASGFLILCSPPGSEPFLESALVILCIGSVLELPSEWLLGVRHTPSRKIVCPEARLADADYP
jgi:hypothetical protein